MNAKLKVIVAAITGSTMIVGVGILAAMLIDLMDGVMVNWLNLRTVLIAMWILGAVVVGVAYWSHSPKGREIWTDEQREALKNLKDGKI